ncbi:hypothetical protein AB4Z48_18005 [Cupriavidus sp. 2TAF22]|uniref:hypothetical protein n=1 Tax=unclassified Cupriavidus TaxID=2640874 RepID=UPI003F92F84F
MNEHKKSTPKLHSERITVTKAEAAERQLVMAIDLWFHDRDILAVHTLASAAYHILRKLNKHRQTGFVGARDALVSLGKSKAEQTEIADVLNHPANYLKHADRDADELLDYNPDMTFLLLVECSQSLQSLNGRHPPECNAVMMWLAIAYIKVFNKRHPIFVATEGPVEELTRDGIPPKLEMLELARTAGRKEEATPTPDMASPAQG